MRALPSALRKQLETSIVAARRAAEGASRAAIDNLGVFSERRPEHLTEEQASLRVGLRAKWRQLGNDRDLLISECAYEQWHRLLFARFLAENKFLLHPEYKAPLTLSDCEELAAGLGEPDGWAVAARFASEILPGIFRFDDPAVRLRLAPEGRHALETILASIEDEAFAADDSLGWVYQFWQKEKKDEVNASERKVGGSDLGPVTQLFTENYMVRFLLENSLGAWWAHKYPDSTLVREFEYLRLDATGRPCAGPFDGWPKRVADFTVMDPCCGSGHFLVEAFSILWRMRAEEEAMHPVQAQDAVLKQNLFGLELDARCVQIATFAVAMHAWKTGGGWRELPVPNLACSGIPIRAKQEDWEKLARGDERLSRAIERLHLLFQNADSLGSLIDPKKASEEFNGEGRRSLLGVDWTELEPLLHEAVANEGSDPAAAVLGHGLAGQARAAAFLSKPHTLIATNVPYLTAKSQTPFLSEYLSNFFRMGRGDLATAFVQRIAEWLEPDGTLALVSPQNWLTLSSYKSLRKHLLSNYDWNVMGQLGEGAFRSSAAAGAFVQLTIISALAPERGSTFMGLPVTEPRKPEAKEELLRHSPILEFSQETQLSNPDSRIVLAELGTGPQLSDAARSFAGIQSGDYPRFGRSFWEMPSLLPGWAFQQSTVLETTPYGGRSNVFYWEDGRGEFFKFVCERLGEAGVAAWIRGAEAWGRPGVAVSQMRKLPVTLYTGELFDNNVAVLRPERPDVVPALWHYCSSSEFHDAVRLLDQKIGVTNATLAKVPFDVDRWKQVAEEAGPLPDPGSPDPTQWLFSGRPEASTSPLQVAVARLVGYRWPEQSPDALDAFADSDGIVCLPSVAGERPAADLLQELLATAWGEEWSPAKVPVLLKEAASKQRSLSDWLEAEFFKNHCTTFGNRPFVWHIWDGRKDGFSALVNYHRLDRKMLEKLTYTYLGQDWAERQRAEAREESPGAAARLESALRLQNKLELIIQGEAPYDIYVRWKPLHKQPIGWEPDLNDGVRLNIRPFVEAGILRSNFNIHWKKDRGRNASGSERHNDVHLSLAEKREARGQADGP